MPQNSIRVIHPYKYQGTWVFDDASKGLDKEAFVSGADIILDLVTQAIPKASKGFTLLFSHLPFPGATLEAHWVREDLGGNWYRFGDQEGWLCPSLFEYFSKAPKTIFFQVKPKA